MVLRGHGKALIGVQFTVMAPDLIDTGTFLDNNIKTTLNLILKVVLFC